MKQHFFFKEKNVIELKKNLQIFFNETNSEQINNNEFCNSINKKDNNKKICPHYSVYQ